MPQISVVVATYNPDVNKLNRTLKQICRQENVSFEVIITDDASSKKDFSHLGEFFKNNGFENFKILEHNENVGTVKNCLSALNEAKGKYVFITSPGDILFDKNTLSDFYNFYSYLEKTYYNPNAVCMFDGIKFTRVFDFPNENVSTKILAEKLTEYVKHYDELLNIYFSNQENERLACALVEKRFRELKDGEIIL